MIVLYMEQSNLDLNLVRVYTKVVEYKSFSTAATQLKMPKSSVSRSVSQLESHLGTQLILRTTRQFSLTQSGEKFYQDCSRLIHDFEAISRHMMNSQLGSEGKIRMTAPLDFGVVVLNPLIIEFSQQNPLVQFDIQYTDEIVNLVREGFDLALRIGLPKDSRLKIRKIAQTSFVLVASPYYLQQSGHPHNPQDLAALNYIHFSRMSFRNSVKFSNGKDEFSVKNNPLISINHFESLKNALLAGKGFGLLPDFFIKHDLQKNNLLPILKNYRSQPIPISWVMPERREDSMVLKNFKNFMTAKIQNYI